MLVQLQENTLSSFTESSFWDFTETQFPLVDVKTTNVLCLSGVAANINF